MSTHTTMIEALLYSWTKNLEYGQRLLADVPEDKMVFQPAACMNHPAWAFSHMNIYHPVIVSLVQGRVFDDPKEHTFGMKSKPLADAKAYPAKQQIIDAWTRGHQDVAAALRPAKAEVFEGPITLERWQKHFPSVGAILVYLMALHEATHLGQISVWRRVQGMPSV